MMMKADRPEVYLVPALGPEAQLWAVLVVDERRRMGATVEPNGNEA
jgi:hypothetical protein